MTPRTPSPPQSTTPASLFSSLSLSTPSYDPLVPTPSSTSTPTPRNSAQILALPVQAGGIIILASDGLSDNLWDEDMLDEVARFKKMYEADSLLRPRPHPGGCVPPTRQCSHSRLRSPPPILNPASTSPHIYARAAPFSTHAAPSAPRAPAPPLSQEPAGPTTSSLHRRALAAMLSEALCSRARCVSERRREGAGRGWGRMGGAVKPESGEEDSAAAAAVEEEDEGGRKGIFWREARWYVLLRFRHAMLILTNVLDISVLVAVVAPAPAPDMAHRGWRSHTGTHPYLPHRNR